MFIFFLQSCSFVTKHGAVLCTVFSGKPSDSGPLAPWATPINNVLTYQGTKVSLALSIVVTAFVNGNWVKYAYLNATLRNGICFNLFNMALGHHYKHFRDVTYGHSKISYNVSQRTAW
jgi:hypothetical protein